MPWAIAFTLPKLYRMETPLVAHIGGMFIRANDSEKLAQWYQTHLGMQHETWGDSKVYYISYPYKDAEGTDHYFAWSIMPFKEPVMNKPNVFTINLRVNNMEQVVAHLQNLGVEVSDVEKHEQGKFAWCKDAEGNQIELWEA
jgi:predicted enzyme related to lactoylglutathione lyase